MAQTIVYTKEQLKKAIQDKEQTIIVKNDELRDYILKSRSSNYGSYAVIAGVMVSAAAVVASGPIGWLGASAIAMISGGTIISIGFATFLICLGIAVIIAVCKDYDVEYQDGGTTLVLKRKN